MTKDAKVELVEFLAHKAFYPVLTAKLKGHSEADKKKLEHVQQATRAEIGRFQGYGSAKEVVVNFRRDLNSSPAKRVHSELRALSLPVISDFREEFERKASELGVTA